MALVDFTDWMNQQSKPGVIWCVKRLSANDTLASGGHQAGPYFPKEILFDLFPSINRPDQKNPDKQFELLIDSHGDVRSIRAVWYNNKHHNDPETGKPGTRNEARLTGFGGGRSPLLDPDSTGALVIFAFHKDSTGEAHACHAWVCDHETEADLVEERLGPVEPTKFKIWSVNADSLPLFPQVKASCWLKAADIPDAWRQKFPSGADIISRTVNLCPAHGIAVDVRLLKRRECEYEIFRSLEENLELPLIKQGFESIDEFVGRAQTILQRRKARSGRSLELHTRAIFVEEQLREGTDFSHQPESDPGKKPDFLFPSETAYRDKTFPDQQLRMLAVKTTCKDRWRQILNEANRVNTKHLLTLQEGVSVNQFREMVEANVRLVVPQPLASAYPKEVQPHLLTLESFIADVRLLNMGR